MKGYNGQSLLMISYVKYIFGSQPNHDLFLHLSIYTCVDFERGHFIFEAMGKVQYVPKGEMQQKKAWKCKRKTHQIGFVVQCFWIKERKKVKVDGVEKEVTVVKSLVTSPRINFFHKIVALQMTAGVS